jgi:hypothetical protein
LDSQQSLATQSHPTAIGAIAALNRALASTSLGLLTLQVPPHCGRWSRRMREEGHTCTATVSWESHQLSSLLSSRTRILVPIKINFRFVDQ